MRLGATPIAALCVVALVAGCAESTSPETTPAGPFIVLSPPLPRRASSALPLPLPPRPTLPAASAPESASGVARDSDALHEKAIEIVVRTTSPPSPVVIDTLSALLLQSKEATSRAERTQDPVDLAAARVAADALSAYIAAQPRPDAGYRKD